MNTKVIERPTTPAQIPWRTTALPRVGETVRASSITSGFLSGLSSARDRSMASWALSIPSITNWRPSGTDLTTGALSTSPSSTIAIRSWPGVMSLVRAIIRSSPCLLSVMSIWVGSNAFGWATRTSLPSSAVRRLSSSISVRSLPSRSWNLYA